MLGARAAAAADDLSPLGAPAPGQIPIFGAADLGLKPPAAARVVAEVRIHAERHVGEVTQVGDDPVDVVRRNAVRQQRGDAQLLEPVGRAAERVALRPAPVLAVDPAQAVRAAAKREPHGDLQIDQRLDHPEQRRRHHRQRLQQDQVRRIGRERPAEQRHRLGAIRATHPVDVAVERERDHAFVRATRLGDRLPCHPDAAARGLHPIHVAMLVTLELAAAVDQRRQRPRVRRDHVGTRFGIAPVHPAHLVELRGERLDPPQPFVILAVAMRQLGGHATVEDHAPLLCDRVLDPSITLRAPRAHANVQP